MGSKAEKNDTQAEMQRILKLQREAFTAELPVSMDVRKDRIKRIIAMMLDHGDAFCKALSEDFGHRSEDQSMITDVLGVIGPAKHALKSMDKWARTEKRKLQFPLGLLGAKARVEYQPMGVVGIVAPWNFPVQLSLSPAIGAFSAGNRVMIKNSEYTENVSNLMKEVGAKYFDESEMAFINGGPEVGQQFTSLAFDHLIFTGATPIGRHVLHAAADNLTPVTLELGGKSPTIIGKSADKKQAADRVALGTMLNAGQICLAPDFLFVAEVH